MSNENLINEKIEIKADPNNLHKIASPNKGKALGFLKKSGYFLSGMSLSFIFLYSYFIAHIVKSDQNMIKEMKELKSMIIDKYNENEKENLIKITSAGNVDRGHISGTSLTIEKPESQQNTHHKNEKI
jgi:hypothetical protein